jgi:exodeoxyribonuclease-5
MSAYTLSSQQGAAVKRIANWLKNEIMTKQVFVLAGFAGTGKSTILPDILDATGLTPEEVAFCAPTGKAAKVMGNKLRAQGINVYPTTVHSLIYLPKPQRAEIMERELTELQTLYVGMRAGTIDPPSGDLKADLKETDKKIAILTKDLDRAYDSNDLRFHLNPDSKLATGEIKLVIVDEGSMVGTTMAEDLVFYDIPVMVMGDPGQLPPVGEKAGFIGDGQTPDAFLTEVHRQAAENPIIHIATLVRKGQRADFGDYGDGVLIIPRKDDKYTLDLTRDAQIIVGTNKHRWKTTSRIRRAGGFTDPLPMAGEPLIMCKNSKVHPTLVNGTQVFSAVDHGDAEEGMARFLASVHDEDGALKQMFAYQGLFEEHRAREKNFSSAGKQAAFKSRIVDNHIDFGWAITCHKSQGSQWDEVIVHDESYVFKEDADKWLYTAVTRAAERLVIVAD